MSDLIRRWFKPLFLEATRTIVNATPCICDTNTVNGSGRIGKCNRCLTLSIMDRE